MNDFFDNNFPDVADLKRHAKKRIPKFAFDFIILQLTQIMNQLGCKSVVDLPNHLVR